MQHIPKRLHGAAPERREVHDERGLIGAGAGDYLKVAAFGIKSGIASGIGPETVSGGGRRGLLDGPSYPHIRIAGISELSENAAKLSRDRRRGHSPRGCGTPGNDRGEHHAQNNSRTER